MWPDEDRPRDLVRMMWFRQRRRRCTHCDSWRELKGPDGIYVCRVCDAGDERSDKIIWAWLNTDHSGAADWTDLFTEPPRNS